MRQLLVPVLAALVGSPGISAPHKPLLQNPVLLNIIMYCKYKDACITKQQRHYTYFEINRKRYRPSKARVTYCLKDSTHGARVDWVEASFCVAPKGWKPAKQRLR